jgi:hypothetical protein
MIIILIHKGIIFIKSPLQTIELNPLWIFQLLLEKQISLNLLFYLEYFRLYLIDYSALLI